MLNIDPVKPTIVVKSEKILTVLIRLLNLLQVNEPVCDY